MSQPPIARSVRRRWAWPPLAICLGSVLASGPVGAGDWPQILGPQRNGVASGESLRATWPAGGPRRQWKVEVGQGYAGPAVVGDRVLIFHRVDNQERLEALAADTGQQLWKADFPANYRGGIDPDKGPRCVPVVHADRVYLHGADGDVHAVELATGRPVWSRKLRQELSGSEGYFGAGSTPIVADGKLLVNVGGRRTNAGLVALSLADGRTAWQATDADASYSSPIPLARATGAAAESGSVLFVTRLTAVAVNPGEGTIQFEFPFGQRGPTVNAASPLTFDKYLFLTASYGIGAQLWELRQGQPVQVWANDETLSSQFTTPVHHAGYLYGTHGREDIGTAELRCVAAATGKVQWSRPDFGVAHTILAGDKLLILTTAGRLVLAPTSASGFEPLATAQLVEGVTRALPALAGGRLYFRTSLGQPNELLCYEVGTNGR